MCKKIKISLFCAIYPIKFIPYKGLPNVPYLLYFQLDKRCHWVSQNLEKLKAAIGMDEARTKESENHIQLNMYDEGLKEFISPEEYMFDLAMICYIFGSKKFFGYLRVNYDIWNYLTKFEYYLRENTIRIIDCFKMIRNDN